MKGYVKVDAHVALQSVENYKNILKEADEKFPSFVKRYYDWKYPQLNFFSKWKRKTDDYIAFMLEDTGWNGYSWILRNVLTEQEMSLVLIKQQRYTSDKRVVAITMLCNVASDNSILVDQEISEFIHSFKDK